MKTGILSMQNVDNYGSLLQAYGLKKTIESLGSNVEFIDIKKIDSDYNLLGNLVEYHYGENDKKSKIQKLFDRDLLIRLFNKRVNKKFVTECNKFRRNFLNIEKKSRNYDLCVIGADEVFNCLNSGWWGYTSQLFGNVPEANSVITYAASCGATKYENIPSNVIDSITKSIKNISGFSVRDKNTFNFIKKFGVNNIEQNLDPVLIYDFDQEVNSAILPKLPKHYCIIYSYFYRFYKKEDVDAILKFCKKYNMTPVAIQGGQTWCKNFIACSPFECLKIFENADFVITDTFHGTIFSAKYANKFAALTRESNYNKLFDLVTRLGIEKHLIKDLSRLEDIYNVPKEQESINAILEHEKERTVNYLRAYINGTK